MLWIPHCHRVFFIFWLEILLCFLGHQYSGQIFKVCRKINAAKKKRHTIVRRQTLKKKVQGDGLGTAQCDTFSERGRSNLKYQKNIEQAIMLSHILKNHFFFIFVCVKNVKREYVCGVLLFYLDLSLYIIILKELRKLGHIMTIMKGYFWTFQKDSIYLTAHIFLNICSRNFFMVPMELSGCLQFII